MKRFLKPEEEARLLAAIERAESKTSGEIRVHIEGRCPGDPLPAARRRFARLGMSGTAERNGVLFYVAARDRKFSVVGDEGIHLHVGDPFWNRLRDGLRERFARGEFAAGLEQAIGEVAEELSHAFPRRSGDVNELPDSISYSGPESGGDEDESL